MKHDLNVLEFIITIVSGVDLSKGRFLTHLVARALPWQCRQPAVVPGVPPGKPSCSQAGRQQQQILVTASERPHGRPPDWHRDARGMETPVRGDGGCP